MTSVHTKVYLAVEGATDLAVAERMIGFVGLEPFPAITAGGKLATMAEPPKSRISSRTRFEDSATISPITMAAPSWASRRAVAAPMP